MERELDIFMYELGGIYEIRIYVNIHFPKMECSVFWKDGEMHESKEVYPIDNRKILGFFNQYVIGLGLSQTYDPKICQHMEQMIKYLKLINHFTFDNLAPELLCRFLNVVKEGIHLWALFFKLITTDFPKEECKRMISLYYKYLMMFHLLLWEHVQVDDGMTLSPLWSK